ncbi:ATP-grasp domain-containing protein [Thermoactinomyces sp. DSM 45891]|uniref:ATP-grasp domain-containing protein n=1 Tax=Thermoactinomyces sp. DSM 45891 TaxID=1761907 RepID=UPI000919F57A|nr:ATP-grasp domain-containing protein [Thermoactinomyces sp. DSM 45891]SFX57131.1 ATP-grasp domain-containing protein [Thermoactinomyces sp. DSM 45891]
MSILIMNKTGYPYDDWLKDLNEDLLLLTTSEKARGAVNYHLVEGFENYRTNGEMEIRALELYETHKFDAIIVTSEYDLIRAARLREQLGIEGQSLESAIAFRDKTVMKKLAREKGLNVPEFSPLESPLDLYKFIQKHGYPVIVKPIDGVGSCHTVIIKDRDDLMTFLSKGLAVHLEVEKFIEGDMYTVDGLVINGEMVLCWPSKYINGCLAFQDELFNGGYLLESENPLLPRLVEFTQKLLKALPTPKNTSFHAEVFHTPHDELVLCEIASRTGGGFIREKIIQGFGIDLVKLSVQAQCGLVEQVSASLSNVPKLEMLGGYLLVPAKKGVLKEMPADPLPEWVTQYKVTAHCGQKFNEISSSGDYIAKVLIKGESEAQVQNRIDELAMWFENRVIWDDTI